VNAQGNGGLFTTINQQLQVSGTGPGGHTSPPTLPYTGYCLIYRGSLRIRREVGRFNRAAAKDLTRYGTMAARGSCG
jgi:hypothetical protein